MTPNTVTTAKNMGINHNRRYVGMSERTFYCTGIGTSLQQVSCDQFLLLDNCYRIVLVSYIHVTMQNQHTILPVYKRMPLGMACNR
jgi:hypothetical protein